MSLFTVHDEAGEVGDQYGTKDVDEADWNDWEGLIVVCWTGEQEGEGCLEVGEGCKG